MRRFFILFMLWVPGAGLNFCSAQLNAEDSKFLLDNWSKNPAVSKFALSTRLKVIGNSNNASALKKCIDANRTYESLQQLQNKLKTSPAGKYLYTYDRHYFETYISQPAYAALKEKYFGKVLFNEYVRPSPFSTPLSNHQRLTNSFNKLMKQGFTPENIVKNIWPLDFPDDLAAFQEQMAAEDQFYRMVSFPEGKKLTEKELKSLKASQDLTNERLLTGTKDYFENLFWDEAIKAFEADLTQQLEKANNDRSGCDKLYVDMVKAQQDLDNKGSDWAGTWTSKTGYGDYTVQISGSGEQLSASTQHIKTNGFTDNGSWGGCKVGVDDSLRCKWNENYEDMDKKITRQGTLVMYKYGNTISGFATDVNPSFAWKPNVVQYTSGVRNGAVWPISIKKKE